MLHLIKDGVIRLRVRVYDRVRSSRSVSELSAIFLIVQYFARRQPPSTKLPLLTTALRRSNHPLVRRTIHSSLKQWLQPPQSDVWRTEKIGWSRYENEIADPLMRKSLVLKAPTSGEKGVLYVSFEVNLLRLCQHCDIERLLAEYYLVLATSWSPLDCQPLLSTANLSPDPLFVQISNREDLELLRVCGSTVHPVPIMACDWIEPRSYAPKPRTIRPLDILMVAGWARLKGHWMLFRALRRMRKGLRVLLVGQNMEGRTADAVYAEAKAFGVGDRIEMIRDAPARLVRELQCDSKIAVVLSRREGSGVVTAESFFADTPVAMLRGAHVGSRAYINDRTGILSNPDRLHRDLSVFLEQSDTYAPRAWALDHITCYHSHRRLNAILRNHAVETRCSWSHDIVPFCWRPDPVYLDDRDRSELAPAYEELHARYGILFAGHVAAPRCEGTQRQ